MRPARGIVLAFIALALLRGIVLTYTSQPLYFAMHWQMLADGALSALFGGIFLLLASVARREHHLSAPQWLVLFVLLVPQWLAILLGPPYVQFIPWLHQTRSGMTFLLLMAAPLWLGLLSALRLVSVEVPRSVVAAGIAGIGTVCLVVPVEAYTVRSNQIPVLLMHLLLNIVIVFTWAYACPRLASAGTLAIAGSYLLLSAIGGAAFSFLLERHAWQPIDWHEVIVPLLIQTAVTAGSLWLWFWLLERMMLPAFTMYLLAAWAASLIRDIAYGSFLLWRVDAALVIAVAAITVALRARVSDEQPVVLGLHSR